MAKRIKGCTNHHRYGYLRNKEAAKSFLYPIPVFGPAVWHVGSQFPKPGIKPCLRSVESYPLDGQ